MATERKAITVYGLPHALAAAAAAAKVSAPVMLLSTPAAAASAGPAWFRAVLDKARDAYPTADIEGTLDCADFGGCALAALREGLTSIIYDGTANVAVADIAGQCGATVRHELPASLDARLAETEGRLEEALSDWLNPAAPD